MFLFLFSLWGIFDFPINPYGVFFNVVKIPMGYFSNCQNIDIAFPQFGCGRYGNFFDFVADGNGDGFVREMCGNCDGIVCDGIVMDLCGKCDGFVCGGFVREM